MRHIDSSLGVPLPDKDYGGNCLIYDPSMPNNPWHNFYDKMDGFVTTHFIGWWLKAVILRDYWLCLVLSVGFELCEYTLEHQLSNFSECWWDHWILDFLVCNGLGIYLGMKTCDYFSLKIFNWRGLWNIPTFKGKLTRIVTQFGPYSWMPYDWRPADSLKRWAYMIVIVIFFLLAELNTFYLKTVLWIPPPNLLVLGRLTFIWFIGAVAMRESFEYLDNPNCKKMGTQTWVAITVIITELLIIFKFDWDRIKVPPSNTIILCWAIFIFGLILSTIWNFYIRPGIHWNDKIKNKTDFISEITNNNGDESFVINDKNKVHMNGNSKKVKKEN
jgi:phosphatidylserine synthase 2